MIAKERLKIEFRGNNARADGTLILADDFLAKRRMQPTIVTRSF